MLIAVMGSSGLNQVEGVSSADPAALLRAVGAQATEHVILLAPWYLESVAKEQAHVVIAAEPRARVAVLAYEHHPLTLTLIAASVQQQMAADADPGDALAMLGQAAARSRSLVWYPRVWGLREPSPTAGQLLASTFRAPGYFREIGPRPALVPGKVGSPVGPTDEVYVAGTSPALLHTQLGTDVRTVPVDLEAGQPYATKTAVAVTVLVGATAPGVSEPGCRCCGAHLTNAGCAFCGTGPGRLDSPAPGQPASAQPALAGASSTSHGTEGLNG